MIGRMVIQKKTSTSSLTGLVGALVVPTNTAFMP